MEVKIHDSVNNLQTISGGTKTSVKVGRPWQPKLVFPTPENPCSFCNRKSRDEHILFEGDRFFRSFQNSNTLFTYHRLLIPTKCWVEEKVLRSLGGSADYLSTFLRMAVIDVVRQRRYLHSTWIYTHIGYGAGQSLTHNHWHMCGVPEKLKKMQMGDHSILFNNEDFLTMVCGVKAGQVLIGNKKGWTLSDLLNNKSIIDKVAEAAYRVVDLFNQKFNYPDYCLFFGFNEEKYWFVRYTPILNNWGGSEFAALDMGTPFVLPWPHEETVKFLLS